LNLTWLLAVKGTNGELLGGDVSCDTRAVASNRNIKTSASIATTFGWSQSNNQQVAGYLKNSA
jgi:hypothetical protein